MPRTKTTIRIKAFRPLKTMRAYMLLTETIDNSTGEIVDAACFFQDLRQTESGPSKLFYEWCAKLAPRVKNPLNSKKFEITIAKPTERFISSRNSFCKQYAEFINKAS